MPERYFGGMKLNRCKNRGTYAASGPALSFPTIQLIYGYDSSEKEDHLQLIQHFFL
jgi:hypothetical protein